MEQQEIEQDKKIQTLWLTLYGNGNKEGCVMFRLKTVEDCLKTSRQHLFVSLGSLGVAIAAIITAIANVLQ